MDRETLNKTAWSKSQMNLIKQRINLEHAQTSYMQDLFHQFAAWRQGYPGLALASVKTARHKRSFQDHYETLGLHDDEASLAQIRSAFHSSRWRSGTPTATGAPRRSAGCRPSSARTTC